MMPTVFTSFIPSEMDSETRLDVRRMEMFSHARRDEFNAMIIAMTPRRFRKPRRNG